MGIGESIEGILYVVVLIGTIVGFWGTVLAAYLIPTIRAFERGHPQRWFIFLLNALLGWTVVGWIVSWIWMRKQPSESGWGTPNGRARTP